MNKRASRLITTLAALAIGLVAMALVPAVFQRAWVYANPGPDLIVESITISPAAPEVGQTVYISVVTRNRGNVGTGTTVTTALYIDPADQPPTYTTRHTTQAGAPLRAYGTINDWYGLYRTHVFTTTGCNHVVYAWADRGERVLEDNEFNNVASATICVGVQGVADSYEPDNTCGASRWVTSTQGLFPQAHTLWPQDDDDWRQVQRRGRRQLHHPGHQPGDSRRPPALPSELVQQPGPIRHRAAHRLAGAQQRALLHLGGRRLR